MVSKKTVIDTLDDKDSQINEVGTNLIRDKMFASIEASRRSKVPYLFLSNPGNGKTTNVATYAAIHGYHLETLSGSHFARDEILGMQTNTGKSYLEILEPEWFHRIMLYSVPHYEVISSGDKFKVVEEETVDHWRSSLNDAGTELISCTKELEDLKSKNLTDETEISINETNIKALNNKVLSINARIERLTNWLNDIEWRPPRKSVLFLDELGAVTGDIQAALLQLCFERKIRSEKELPEDCIVLGAANYKGNVPSYFKIIAPELNRFCIINLLPGSKNSERTSTDYSNLGISIVREFTQYNRKGKLNNLPTFRTDFVMNEETEELLCNEVCSQLTNLVNRYSSIIDTSLVSLDFRNTYFDGMFDRADDIPEVFNFISGRSISNYILIMKSLCEMGVTSSDREIFAPMVDGLLGLGTNNWDDSDAGCKAQMTEFQSSLYSMTATILSAFQENVVKIEGESKSLDMESSIIDESTIDGMVQKAIQLSQENSFEPLDEYGTKILNAIAITFDSEISADRLKAKLIEMESDNNKIIKFRSDYEAVLQYIELLKSYANTDSSIEIYTDSIRNTLNMYKFYYTSIIHLGANKESIQ